MPATDTWSQYPLIAIIVLVIGLLGLGARKFWLEFTTWQDKQAAKLTAEQDKQDVKRKEEREIQRAWEAEQNRMREDAQDRRELAWRSMVGAMEERQDQNAKQTNKLLGELVENMNCLARDLHTHDEYTRDAMGVLVPESGTNSGAAPNKTRGRKAG
jgi:thioesterase domain-containing protein